jgi:processive 1,2-diacylglycerol beta-glucosyltransferase
MEKKRILITPMEVGNGHKAPSMAIKKSIERLYPGKYDVDVIDISKERGSRMLYSIHYHFWIDIALRFPSILKLLYKITDNKFSSAVEEALVGGLANKVKQYAEETKPDMIVATHSTYVRALSRLRKELKMPLVALDTDPFDVHYFWVSANMNNYVVFSKEAKSLFAKRGVKKDTIKVFDRAYPLDPKHSAKVDSQKAIRKKFGLKNNMTLLMSFGGEGVGNIKDYLMSIIKNNLNMQVVVICGRNEKIKNELESIKMPDNSKVALKIFGFVENMQDFIQASDIVLGKPGASQTFEVLAKKRPIIYTTYMQNEYTTLEFVLKNKYGWYTPKIKEFIELLEKMQKNPSVIKRASSGIKGIKTCSDEVAKFLVEKLENG